MNTTTEIKVGDKVTVPGRYRNLTVRQVSGGRIFATFDSGFGFYEGPAHEFAKAVR